MPGAGASVAVAEATDTTRVSRPKKRKTDAQDLRTNRKDGEGPDRTTAKPSNVQRLGLLP